MSERGGVKAVPRSVARPSVGHYLVAWREARGLGPPYVFSNLGEGVMPVFRSGGAAREFLRSLALGDGWHVRQFSGGELVSLLCAFSAEVQRVLPDPPGRHRSSGGVPAAPMTRERFIEALIAGSTLVPPGDQAGSAFPEKTRYSLPVEVSATIFVRPEPSGFIA